MANPRVSIILATRNRSHLLRKTVPVILRQTFADFELIIINDGSNDDTDAAMAELAVADKRIVTLRNEKNIGINPSTNRGMHIARGRYVAIADDDDPWIDERKLEKQVGFLEAHPDYVGVGGGMVVVDGNGKELLRYLKPESDTAIRNSMYFSNPMANPTALFRMDAAKAIGFYDESVRHGGDRDFWMHIGTQGRLYNFPEYFCQYTVAGQNTLFREVGIVFRTSVRLVWKYRGAYPRFVPGLLFSCAQFLYSLVPSLIRAKLNIPLFRLKRALFDKVS